MNDCRADFIPVRARRISAGLDSGDDLLRRTGPARLFRGCQSYSEQASEHGAHGGDELSDIHFEKSEELSARFQALSESAPPERADRSVLRPSPAPRPRSAGCPLVRCQRARPAG